MKNVDEISNFINARYVSSSEALWRIFGFKLHQEYPFVQRLAVHLPNAQLVTFDETKEINEILNKNIDTTLTG